MIGMLLVNLIFSLALFEPKLHTGGDNAGYIMLAESILRLGDGYSEGYRPGPPVPHTQYPFGYPLLLTPLVALFGRNVLAFKFFSLALAVGSVALFSLLIKTIFRPVQWGVLTLAIAINPVIIDYSHWILSESAFLFFNLLSFKLFLDSEKKEKLIPGVRFWLALVSIALTVHVRTIGMAFIIAGSAYYLLRRKWRKLLLYTVVLTALILPWVIRNTMVQEGHAPYIEQILMKNVYSPDQGMIGVGGLLARIGENIRIYSVREMGRVIINTNGAWEAGIIFLLISVSLTLIVVVGFLGSLVRRRNILELYTLVYMGGILIFPEVVSDVRYLMPLVPLVLIYLADGIALIAHLPLFRKVNGGKLVTAVVLLVALISLVSQIDRVPANLDMLSRYNQGDPYAGYPAPWRNLFQAGDWICENTPEERVITVRKPRLFHIHIGRKVDGYPFTTNTDSVLKRITSSDYVVVDAVSGTTYRYLIPAIQKVPERFKLVYRLDKPFTGVLEVVK